MSDRDGLVLRCEPPLSPPMRIALATLTIGLAVALVDVAPNAATFVLFVDALVLGMVLVTAGTTRLLFRARHIEVRWLYSTRIAYRDITGIGRDERGVLVRLHDGSTRRLRVRVDEAIAEQFGPRDVRDTIADALSSASGVIPDGGPIATMGYRDLPAAPEITLAPALLNAFQRASHLARGRGTDWIGGRDFVRALVSGPERALLLRAGLDAQRMPAHELPNPHRDGDRLPFASSFEVVLRSAGAQVAARQTSVIRPEDVLLALFIQDADTVHALIAAGVRPIRLVDHLAHRLSRAESDARAEGTVSDDTLLAGTSKNEVSVVLVNDDYTPVALVLELLTTHLELTHDRANQIARAVHEHGRASLGSLPGAEAAGIARTLMREARRRGAPLLVELSDPGP